MDELKLKLSTKFMRVIASKLISKIVYKRYGYKIKIRFDEIDVRIIDGDATIKLNLEANMDSSDFMNIIKNVDLD